jgi:glycine cleavage system H protein
MEKGCKAIKNKIRGTLRMDITGYNLPDDLFYTREHEWGKVSGNLILIGITDYAAKTLNDVVYVTFPKVEQKVKQFKSIGTVESIKAVSELYSPVSGTVTKVNHELETHPELVNKSPYAEGWLVELRPDDFASERKNLMDSKSYASFIQSLLKD